MQPRSDPAEQQQIGGVKGDHDQPEQDSIRGEIGGAACADQSVDAQGHRREHRRKFVPVIAVRQFTLAAELRQVEIVLVVAERRHARPKVIQRLVDQQQHQPERHKQVQDEAAIPQQRRHIRHQPASCKVKIDA